MGYKHNKDDILETGFHVLRKNGYHGVGINEILKQANIPKGSFYNFFESKEDFAKQVLYQYGEEQKSWIEEFFAQNKGTPIENLLNFYETLIVVNEQDNFMSGCLVNVLSNEVGRTNDTLAAEANQCFLGWITVIAREIEKGQEQGEITTQFSALELAEYMHSGMYGAFARMKVTRNRVYLDIWRDITFDFIKR